MFEADGEEDLLGFLVPVTRRAFETVEGAKEAPVGVLGGVWAAWWRTDNVLFGRGEDALAEGLRDVAAFGNAFHTDGDGAEKTHFRLTEDGGEAVVFVPVVVIEVTEDNDAIFAAFGVALFVFFDF